MDLLKVFRGRVVDVAPDCLIVEVSGTVDKIDGLLEVLRPYGVLEMARTGRIAMTRAETCFSRLTVRPSLQPQQKIENS